MTRNFILLVMSLVILAACSREDGVPVDESIGVNEPNRFAQYLNPLASLQAGKYTIVAATAAVGKSGTFTLTVTYDDGEEEVFSGSWTNSGGMDPASANNPSFKITLDTPGGIRISLKSSVNNYLYLLNDSAAVIAENDDRSATNKNALINLEASQIDSEAFGAAYYAAVDPRNTRDTLEKWKQANGYYKAYNAGRVFEPRFRDTKDLGYGRGIRGWTKKDGSLFFFVENFQVRSVPGLEYTGLNLEALIKDDRQHHFGSNAIEYSTYPYGPGEPCAFGSGKPCATTNPAPTKFLKFYTFDATQGDQTRQDHENEVRLNTVNLDGRGYRAMPGACVYCHGGTLRPLRGDGTFRDNTYDGTAGNGLNGDTNAKFQLMEVSSFEFWPESPYTQAEQEPIIKEVNKLIYCTYPGADASYSANVPSACAEYCVDPNNPADCDGLGTDVANVIDNGTGGAGEWSGDFAVEMAEGWYDDDPTSDARGDGIPDFDSETFRQDFVPPGWQPNAITGTPPPGADRLFVEVVQPVCFVCHSRRGTTLGTDSAVNGTKDVDFSTWEKFISHSDLIEQYVYERGVMPLSLRGFKAFWATDGPDLLANFIPGFSHTNADGSIDQPGDPKADAGPDRSTPSPARLHGVNSRFVNSYLWEIVSTPAGGESATITDPDKPSAVLKAPVDGDYVIRLTASNGLGQSDKDKVTIKIDSFMVVEPKDLVFWTTVGTCGSTATEICTILQTTAPTGGNCVSCHVTAGVAGIPMWWTDAQPLTGADTLYKEFRARVDFNDPEKSLVLTKPSGNHHYGGLITGFEVDNPSNREHYDTILNWILEGAREI